MTPGTFNLAIYHGDTYAWQFKIWADAGKKVPADLSHVTVKAEIRSKPGGTLITSFDCTIVLPNIINMALNATESLLLAPLVSSPGAWDLQLTYDTGAVQTPVAGSVTVTMDVTDSVSEAAVLQQRKIRQVA